MKIGNNQLWIDFNEENICKDYDLFKIEKDQGYFKGVSILDDPTLKADAESVYYEGGGKVIFALYKKGVVEKQKLRDALIEKVEDICVKKLNIKEALNQDANTDKIYRHQLAQLLFNTLGKARKTDWSYNNLLGGLYYWNAKWKKNNKDGTIKYLWMLKLSLSNKCYVKLEVQTFSTLAALQKNVKPPLYCFDEQSMRFRRLLSGDQLETNQIYGKKSCNPNKHNTIPFIDFLGYDTFMASKMGVLHMFLRDVEKYLSSYMQIKLGCVEEYEKVEVPEYSLVMGQKEYGDELRTKDIVIVDSVRDVTSKGIGAFIQEQLEQYYGLEHIRWGEVPQSDAYNIRIIRNREYYENNELEDPHDEIWKGHIIQHVTTDDFKVSKMEKEHPAVTKIIQELLIKKDLVDRRISIAKWEHLKYENTWTFVVRQLVFKEDKEKVKSYNIYYRMRIQPNGEFYLDSYESDKITFDDEWVEINSIYASYDKKTYLERRVEGIIYSDISKPSIILETERFTVPEIEEIMRRLDLSRGTRAIGIEEIKEYLIEYKEVHKHDSEEACNCITQLEVEHEESIYYRDLLKIINIRKKFGQQFNDYLYETTGKLLHGRMKKGEVMDELLNSVIDIKYFSEKDKLLYFVGKKRDDIKTSLPTSCKIREVVSGEDDFPMLMQLMLVDFVRNQQCTVLPFPFKYLREYMSMSKN